MQNASNTHIHGVDTDEETRCVHWHGKLDIIAIKMACCRKYYSCHSCHELLENHVSEVWNQEDFDEFAILCGSCKSEIRIADYLEKHTSCAFCNANFNPRCINHHHLYFENRQKPKLVSLRYTFAAFQQIVEVLGARWSGMKIEKKFRKFGVELSIDIASVYCDFRCAALIDYGAAFFSVPFLVEFLHFSDFASKLWVVDCGEDNGILIINRKTLLSRLTALRVLRTNRDFFPLFVNVGKENGFSACTLCDVPMNQRHDATILALLSFILNIQDVMLKNSWKVCSEERDCSCPFCQFLHSPIFALNWASIFGLDFSCCLIGWLLGYPIVYTFASRLDEVNCTCMNIAESLKSLIKSSNHICVHELCCAPHCFSSVHQFGFKVPLHSKNLFSFSVPTEIIPSILKRMHIHSFQHLCLEFANALPNDFPFFSETLAFPCIGV